jgi:hypothetical protein
MDGANAWHVSPIVNIWILYIQRSGRIRSVRMLYQPALNSASCTYGTYGTYVYIDLTARMHVGRLAPCRYGRRLISSYLKSQSMRNTQNHHSWKNPNPIYLSLSLSLIIAYLQHTSVYIGCVHAWLTYACKITASPRITLAVNKCLPKIRVLLLITFNFN